MKKYLYLLMCLVLAACGSQSTSNISSDTSKTAISKAKVTVQSILSEIDKGKYVQNELLVKFKKGTAKAASTKVHLTVGASVIQNIKLVPNVDRVKLQQGLSVKDAIAQYMSDPNVEYAEPNYIRKSASAEVIPNDPFFKDQWSLRNTGQYAYGTAGADIDATDAWRVSKGNYGIVIAVLDTGVDYNHNDLASNMWRNASECNGVAGVDDDNNGFIDDCKGWDFVTCEDLSNCPVPGTGDNDPMDQDGHGTHVAGIIGAAGNNGVGISGVMWNVLMMPVRVLNQNGEGSDADIAAGIAYAVKMGAKVINASFGGFGTSQTLMDAVSDANAKGVLFVASAGNDSNNNDLNPVYPASYPFDNIISVTATDQNDQRAPFSNFGHTSVDVAAPGVYIFSTVPTWRADSQGFSYGEEFLDGTSMAAPHVTGLAGLLYSYYINFNYSQIRNMILNCVDVLPSLDGWVATRGRINAFSSMSALWEPYDLKLKQNGGVVELSWTDVATFEENTIIERKIQGGTYAVIQILGPNVNSYTDRSVIEGLTYFYRVRMKNWIGESPGHPDNERSVSTGLIAPSGLSATAISASKVKLTWFDGSSAETDFRIYRHDTNGAYTQIKQVGRNVTTFTDTGLAKGTKYWYQVKAHNVTGYSEPSNEAEVTTSNASSSHGGGGGGGCSIGAKQNAPTALADISVMLLPLLVIAVLRRRR